MEKVENFTLMRSAWVLCQDLLQRDSQINYSDKSDDWPPETYCHYFSISGKLCCLIQQPNHPCKGLMLQTGIVGTREALPRSTQSAWEDEAHSVLVCLSRESGKRTWKEGSKERRKENRKFEINFCSF